MCAVFNGPAGRIPGCYFGLFDAAEHAVNVVACVDCDVLVIEASDLASLGKDADFKSTVHAVRKMVVGETSRHFGELTSMLYNLQRDIGYPISFSLFSLLLSL